MRGSPLSLPGCEGSDRAAAGDINGDGFSDIVVSYARNNKLSLYLGSKNGTFAGRLMFKPAGRASPSRPERRSTVATTTVEGTKSLGAGRPSSQHSCAPEDAGASANSRLSLGVAKLPRLPSSLGLVVWQLQTLATATLLRQPAKFAKDCLLAVRRLPSLSPRARLRESSQSPGPLMS